MKKILIINTGGTFNKVYNPLTGNLDIEPTGNALKAIASSWLTAFEIVNIIGKDSLDMTEEDRAIILQTIEQSDNKNIIIVHGTDTMDKTAMYIAKENLKKRVILTGAMVPFYINPIESVANLASAYGYLQSKNKKGVIISMNGVVKDHKRVVKNKEKGYFEESK
jgi:L-asparaginase